MSWIIYKHTNKINGKIYIGQSKYSWKNINDRWQSGRGYHIKTRFGSAIKKYGWENFDHHLLEDNITSQNIANEREIYWIRYFNSYYDGYNCTPGGNNVSENFAYKVKIYCSNNKITYDSIISASQQLNTSYHKIVRQITTGHYYKTDDLYFCLESEKDDIKIEFYTPKYDFSSLMKSVICVETREIYDSVTECSKAIGVKTQNISVNCCKNHRTAKGKHYAYLEDFDENWLPAEEYNTNRRKKLSSLKKKIFCYQNNKIYLSATDAAEELGISVRAVCRCAKKDGDLISTHGYNFCYLEDWYEGWTPRKSIQGKHKFSEEQKSLMRKNNKNSKKVKCVDTGKVYRSLNEASRETGISSELISRVAAHKKNHNTAGGFRWEYIEE